MMTAKRATTPPTLPDLVIITGLSGSGMSAATNAFEDLGYFCVDNLPVTLLPTFARLLDDSEEKKKIERAALVINIRERDFLEDFPAGLDTLIKQGLNVAVIFLEAVDEVLHRRFSETRRPHPSDQGDGLAAAIARERGAMKKIREIADSIIDTSEHTVHTLRRLLIEKFNPSAESLPFQVQIVSFGHKYGTPRDLDLMFDVRHLPNPYFIENLRHYSGNHAQIVKYLKNQPMVGETIDRFADLLNYLLPFYQREGKSYLTVGIGCTGGRHRSVMVANDLSKKLRARGFAAQSVHRDVKKAAKRASSI